MGGLMFQYNWNKINIVSNGDVMFRENLVTLKACESHSTQFVITTVFLCLQLGVLKNRL